jgi:hypothetical protein
MPGHGCIFEVWHDRRCLRTAGLAAAVGHERATAPHRQRQRIAPEKPRGVYRPPLRRCCHTSSACVVTVMSICICIWIWRSAGARAIGRALEFPHLIQHCPSLADVVSGTCVLFRRLVERPGRRRQIEAMSASQRHQMRRRRVK